MKKFELIFTGSSITFLLFLIVLFTARLIYFSKEEKNPIKIDKKIYDVIVMDNSENLYKTENNYNFIGKDSENYIVYSGNLWRIIRVNQNDLTLVMDKPLTNLYFNNSYKESLINKRLKEFYNELDTNLIIDTKTCIMHEDIETCKEEYTNKIVIPSYEMYKQTGLTDSFMNNGYYTYLSNYDGNYYYITDKGDINYSKIENFYDREKLTDYINNLY